MNAQQIITDIERFIGTSNGQLLLDIIEGQVTAETKARVDADVITFYKQKPNSTETLGVLTITGREFHALREDLGPFFGWMAGDIAQNNVQCRTAVSNFVTAEIESGISSGWLLQNATGQISVNPNPPQSASAQQGQQQ